MKHTIKLLTLAAILTAVFGLTGCPGPVNNYIEPVHEHVWTEVTTKYVAPTCTTKGSKTYVCNLCGETKVEELDALGHNWVLESDTATCTENGKKTYKCSRCNETRTENSPAHGHNFEGGYCETCGHYEFENHFTVRVYTSREEFIADNYTPMLRLSSNNENNNLYGECKFSFESENPSMTVDTLIHKKLRYLNYSVMAYKRIDTGNTILTPSGNEINISDIYSIYIEPTN